MRFVSLSIWGAMLSSLVFSAGCDDVADRQSFVVSVENVSQIYEFSASGTFDTPTGATTPGPIGPGMSYDFEIAAAPGARLSFATMFVMSNDFFYAPSEEGLALFDDDGQPIAGNFTKDLLLWDAGTETNQEPGAGADQPLNQIGPNTGSKDANDLVRVASDTFGNLPAIDKVIELTIKPGIGNVFAIHIGNVSTDTTLSFTGGSSAVALSPGVWVVHTASSPLFANAKPEPGLGLEALAEDGNPTLLAENIDTRTGLTGPIAPGAYAVHPLGVEPIFEDNAMASIELERLAEDGLPATLADTLRADRELTDSGSFEVPVGAVDPAPAPSGSRYEFTITAYPDDRLSLATMLVQSNDLFFAFGPEGLALFNLDGTPINGDVSDALGLWDAGTEVNEFPGAGANQAPRQKALNSGTPEFNAVAPVSDDFQYPEAADFVRVTVTPISE